jgi:molecular chaperone GrpE
MRKGNGKNDGSIDLKQQENLDRELPPAEGSEGPASVSMAGNAVDMGTLSETDKLKAERDALLDRLARLQAEFDNARKRAVREQQEFREFAAMDVIRNFLPIFDSFELALKAAGSNPSDFRSGVDLIYRQFQDALQKAGVSPIAAVGQPFDPRVHEAIEMVDTSDVPDHHVLGELQRGYKYKDRLLRPAMVRVARNSRS